MGNFFFFSIPFFFFSFILFPTFYFLNFISVSVEEVYFVEFGGTFRLDQFHAYIKNERDYVNLQFLFIAPSDSHMRFYKVINKKVHYLNFQVPCSTNSLMWKVHYLTNYIISISKFPVAQILLCEKWYQKISH